MCAIGFKMCNDVLFDKWEEGYTLIMSLSVELEEGSQSHSCIFESVEFYFNLTPSTRLIYFELALVFLVYKCWKSLPR